MARPRRRQYIYIAYDYDTDKEIGSFSSFTRDTAAKMRDYLVKCGDIPPTAYVRDLDEMRRIGEAA